MFKSKLQLHNKRWRQPWCANIYTTVDQSDIIMIAMTCSLFPPWYSWKNAHLALNNNHSLTPHKYTTLSVLHVLIVIRSRGMSEWLLINVKMSNFHPLYQRENKLLFDEMWWCMLCTRPNRIVQAHWNKSNQVQMMGHTNTLSRFRASQSPPLVHMVGHSDTLYC